MEKQNPNRISELRLARRWNQRELAEAVGVHYMTISKLERGEMRLTQEWMERLAKALNVTPGEVISDSPLIRSVYMVGSLMDDYDLIRSMSIDQEEDRQGIKFEVDYGVSPPRTSMFFFVLTNKYNPIMHFGDVARFSSIQIDSGEPEKSLGRLCIIERDEPRSAYVGILERGSAAGLFDLRFPFNGYERSIRPSRIHILTLVLGLPQFQHDDEGVPT